MKTHTKTIKCECCRHPIEVRMANQRFCPSCAVYTSNLRYKLTHLQRVLKTARNQLFLLKRGIHR